MFKLIKFFLRSIILLAIVAAVIFVYAKYIEPFNLKTNEVDVRSPYVSETASGLKIAVFADTHFGEYYSVSDFDKVLSSLEKLKPDIVVFAGDLIDHYNEYEDDPAKISAALSAIDAPLGKFAVFGNHDYGGGAENAYEGIMAAGGFTVLKNEYIALDEQKIALVGIDDILIGHGDPSIASWCRDDYFNIILCHEPDVADQVLDYNVDLMLSAHTHGRQINLMPLDDYILPPYGKKYIKGFYEPDSARGMELYVNPGIGMTKLPYRFLSRPELTGITLGPDTLE